MKSKTVFVLLTATLLLSSQSSVNSQTFYTAKLIGENSRNSYFNATAINDLGYATGQRNNAAYIWNPHTATFQTLSWDTIGYGLDINNQGQVVGFVGDSNAVIWSGGVGKALGNWRSVAKKVNNSGVSVGWQYNLNQCCWPQNAAIWYPSATLTLSSGGQMFEAHSINDSGTVVGITSSRQLFVWNGQSHIYDDIYVGELDINDSGIIIGNLRSTNDGFIFNGSQFTIVDDMQMFSINSNGVAVGQSFKVDLQGAVVLDAGLKKVLLRSRVVDGTLGDALFFSKALDVNDLGQILVEGANPENGGNTQYYLLTPALSIPEATARSMLALGLLVLGIGKYLSKKLRR